MRTVRFCYLFLIYSSVLILGTPPMLVPLQISAMAVILVGLFVGAVRQRIPVFSHAFLLFMLAFSLFALLSMVVSIANGLTPLSVMLRFFVGFLTTFTVPLFAYGLGRLGIFSIQRTLNHIVIAILCYCAAKLLIIFIVGITNTEVGVIDVIFIKFFNTAPTTGGLPGSLFRFMAPADFFSAPVLYYILVYRRGWFRFNGGVLLAISLYASFSRFIWLETAFALSLCFFSLSRGHMLAILLSFIVLLPAAAILGGPTLEQRLNDPGSQKSDDLRSQQSEALSQEMEKHLMLGYGMGSFTYKVIRDPVNPYSYEVQWLELLYQMGLVGLFFIVGLLTIIARPLLMSQSLEALPVLALLGFSLLSGFANPSLLGRTAAVGFALFYCLGCFIQDRAKMRPGRPVGRWPLPAS